MADVDLYQNYLSKHHAGAQDPRMYEQAVEIYGHLYRGLLPEDRAAPILDVGAGMGQFLHFLKVNGHGNHLGIDIGDEQVAWCREHVTPNVRKIAEEITGPGGTKSVEKQYRIARTEIEEMRDLGGSVLVLAQIHAVGRASGVEVQQRFGGIWTFGGDKLVKARAYRTQDEAVRAAAERKG